MEDLISRDALIKAITGIEVKWHIKDGLTGTSYDWTYIKDIILSAPTVEAEPVVHCKECKSFMEYTKEYALSVEGADGDCYIRMMNSDNKQFCSCKYDDFCSYGAKMDGV